jgi:hypothetical protein
VSDDPQQNYDKARDLAEKALDEAVEGNDAKAEKLAEEAKALDPDAVQDVVDELAQDAESDPQQIREELGNDADKE